MFNALLIFALSISLIDLIVVPYIVARMRYSNYIDDVWTSGVGFSPRIFFPSVYRAILIFEILIVLYVINDFNPFVIIFSLIAVGYLIDLHGVIKAIIIDIKWYPTSWDESEICKLISGISDPRQDYARYRFMKIERGYSLGSKVNITDMIKVYTNNKLRFILDFLIIAVICNIL